jgi:hypothetical protein
MDKEDVITFNTSRGSTYLITPSVNGNLIPIVFSSKPNDKPKHFSEATLGKERTFDILSK